MEVTTSGFGGTAIFSPVIVVLVRAMGCTLIFDASAACATLARANVVITAIIDERIFSPQSKTKGRA
jgi:hypothetical protein